MKVKELLGQMLKSDQDLSIDAIKKCQQTHIHK
jgi:hypothetical protein